MKNKVVNNASWLIGCHLLQAVLNLLITMMTARMFGPSNFGVLNYASSVVAFAFPFANLGIRNVLVQEFISHDSFEEGEILGTTYGLTFASSVLSILGILAFSFVFNRNEPETIIVCFLYGLSLIVQIFEMTSYWFLAKLKSKYSSIITLVSFLFTACYKFILLFKGKSLRWFALSYSLDYFIIGILLVIVYKKMGGSKFSFSFAKAKDLFSRSKYYILSELMIVIFGQTDRIMLNLMIDPSATGFYSAALTCAGMTSFIFTAIINSFRPIIFEAHNHDDDLFSYRVTLLYSIIIYSGIIQSFFISIFAELIIKIIYGVAYTPAVPILRFAAWYTILSYIGPVRNIWILAENKQRRIWIYDLLSAVLNVILNYIMIPIFGMGGAALATLFTQLFGNVILGFLFNELRPNNKLLVKSLNPKYLFRMVRDLLEV